MSKSIQSQFFSACVNGMHDLFDSLVADGNVPTSNCLVAACEQGDQYLVTKLLGFQMDSFQEAFMAAVRHSQYHLLECLYPNVEINKPDRSGRTALIMARDTRIVKWLLDMGATQIPDNEGHTPLLRACAECNLESIKLLTNHTVSHINLANKFGDTPLGLACSNYADDCIEIVKLLLDLGATQVPNNDGKTPLHYACKYKCNKVARLLLEHGATQTPDNDGSTPLHIACKEGSIELVKLLLKYGATQTPKNNGVTPLHCACFFGGVTSPQRETFCCRITEMVKLLLEHGATQTPNNNGVTPLHLFAFSGYAETVKLLLGYGATQTRDLDGNLPIDLALQEGHVDVIKLLE